jgi:hypothetical protein
MRVAFGLNAHSGWAALVVLGREGREWVVVDRRRVELVEDEWAKQPYHAAEELEKTAARATVRRGVDSVRRIAVREMRELVEEYGDVAACGVVVGDPMPGWSVDEILAVHFRMHKAEGVLFRDALVRAADGCRIRVAEIHQKELAKAPQISRPAGPPWGKDQKDAAAAALLALSRV